MKKKGFTLLELLAVIIILAVIALITTPVVLNVVDEAKKSAFQDSTYGLIKSGEYYYTSQILNGGMSEDKTFIFPNAEGLEFKGTKPESGYIKVTKDGLVEIAVSDGKYCATKGLNEETVTITDYVEGECGLILQAPVISLNGDILNIVSNDDRVEEYEIYVDGILKTTISAMSQETNKVSGTWQFNDVLTQGNFPQQSVNYTFTMVVPDASYSDVVSFVASGSYFYQEGGFSDGTIGSLQYGFTDISGAAVGSYFYNGSSSEWSIHYLGTTREGIENALVEEFGYADPELLDKAYLCYGEGIKTVTFTSEQEVSSDFYDWFTVNANQIGVSYDLLSLNLENGIYDITVKAIADGYESTKFSNSVEYKVVNRLSGVWMFNETLSLPDFFPSSANRQTVVTVNFLCNGIEHQKFIFDYSVKDPNYNYKRIAWTDNLVHPYYWYASGTYGRDTDLGWQAEKYRIIDFGSTPQTVGANFYAWFTANATKQ